MVLYDYWNKADYFCTIFYSAEMKEKLHFFCHSGETKEKPATKIANKSRPPE